MSTALNRRAAELSGWRVVATEPYWYALLDPEGNRRAISCVPHSEEAWKDIAPHLPDFSGDPAVAMAKLAGDRLLWNAHTWYVGGDRMIGVYFDADGTEWEGVAPVVNGDEARAFAEAAAGAWCQWKEAGE